MKALDFHNKFRSILQEALQDNLESGRHLELLDEHVRRDEIDADWAAMLPEERDAVIYLKELGRQLGGDPGEYADGILEITFKNKDAVGHYADELEDIDVVLGYEIEAKREVMVDGYMDDKEYDMDDVLFDKDFEFNCIVYLDPEIVTYGAEEIEIEGEDIPEDENGIITEVRRRVKVNFRGKRRIKMQCRPGFKWMPESRSCVKITGAEVAQKRRAMRRAVRTRKAQGASFKVRMLRKTRKARRFRKSMGLRT